MMSVEAKSDFELTRYTPYLVDEACVYFEYFQENKLYQDYAHKQLLFSGFPVYRLLFFSIWYNLMTFLTDHETTNPAFQNISATAPMLSMRVGTPGDKSMNSSIGTLQVTTTTPHLDREPEQPRPSKQKTKKSRSNSDEYDDFVTSTRSDNESLASTTSLNLSQPPPPSSKHKTKTVKRKSQVQPPKGKAKGTRGAKTPTSSTTAKRRKTGQCL